jgi:hypothetical protein
MRRRSITRMRLQEHRGEAMGDDEGGAFLRQPRERSTMVLESRAASTLPDESTFEKLWHVGVPVSGTGQP